MLISCTKWPGGMELIKRMFLMGIVISLLGVGVSLAQSGENNQVFSMGDPRGDAFGPGYYTYPEDQSFPQELPDMLDLVEFRVLNTEGTTRFEFQFAQPPNLVQPWGGAGYNFHRIDLYITNGGKGSKETFRPGARVQFKEPWQVNLRIRDWQGAYLHFWEDAADNPQAGIWQGETDNFNVFVQGSAIVAEISHEILQPAEAIWGYYVLIGLQDAYGPDHYRKVAAEAGPWTGGGGSATEFNPNVYDILANDAKSQERQLDWSPGTLAKLTPAGKRSSGGSLRYLAVAAVVLAATGTAILLWLYRKK